MRYRYEYLIPGQHSIRPELKMAWVSPMTLVYKEPDGFWTALDADKENKLTNQELEDHFGILSMRFMEAEMWMDHIYGLGYTGNLVLGGSVSLIYYNLIPYRQVGDLDFIVTREEAKELKTLLSPDESKEYNEVLKWEKDDRKICDFLIGEPTYEKIGPMRS